jgi:transcriptional antiterminator NusG
VIEGPFKDLSGKVEHVDAKTNKVRVKIEIFGMPTPVDLDVMQVEKI